MKIGDYRRCPPLLTLLVCSAFVTFIRPNIAAAAGPQLQAASPVQQQKVEENYGKLPIFFEKNAGQTDKRAKFVARGNGYGLFLTQTGAVLSLRQPSKDYIPAETRRQLGPQAERLIAGPKRPDKQATVQMQMVGANPQAQIKGVAEQEGKSNYFIGNDPDKWRTDVEHFGQVKYAQVWPGIDAVYYGNQQQLEYDFIVAPGADPSRIRLKFSGADKIEISDKGELVLYTAVGTAYAKAR